MRNVVAASSDPRVAHNTAQCHASRLVLATCARQSCAASAERMRKIVDLKPTSRRSSASLFKVNNYNACLNDTNTLPQKVSLTHFPR